MLGYWSLLWDLGVSPEIFKCPLEVLGFPWGLGFSLRSRGSLGSLNVPLVLGVIPEVLELPWGLGVFPEVTEFPWDFGVPWDFRMSPEFLGFSLRSWNVPEFLGSSLRSWNVPWNLRVFPLVLGVIPEVTEFPWDFGVPWDFGMSLSSQGFSWDLGMSPKILGFSP